MKVMSILKTVAGATTAIVGGIVALKASKGLKEDETTDTTAECTMPSVEDMETTSEETETEEEEEKEKEN